MWKITVTILCPLINLMILIRLVIVLCTVVCRKLGSGYKRFRLVELDDVDSMWLLLEQCIIESLSSGNETESSLVAVVWCPKFGFDLVHKLFYRRLICLPQCVLERHKLSFPQLVLLHVHPVPVYGIIFSRIFWHFSVLILCRILRRLCVLF